VINAPRGRVSPRGPGSRARGRLHVRQREASAARVRAGGQAGGAHRRRAAGGRPGGPAAVPERPAAPAAVRHGRHFKTAEVSANVRVAAAGSFATAAYNPRRFANSLWRGS